MNRTGHGEPSSGSRMAATPLRILHVVPYYEDAWAYGGIPRLATTMTRALARRGHSVTVCTTDVRDQDSRVATVSGARHGIDVRIFPNVSNRLAYHLQLFTPIGLRAYLRGAAGSFDIAHLHACHNLPVAFAARALQRAGVPYVISPNGTAKPIERRILAKRMFAATAGRRVLSGAARVLAVTETERLQLVALGVPDSHISIVPNPIESVAATELPDGARFRAEHGLGTVPVVLYLGKLTPRKGLGDLIRAFARLDTRGVVLVIAGNDMGAGAAADRLVRQLGLSGRVRRPGLLTGTERLDALAAADVLVYPSRDEIFGLVPLEALQCHTPVVVCDDSGCGEVIGRTGGGRIVPHADPAALGAAITSILAEPDRWRAIARTAAVKARALFGAEAVCDRLERVYRDVCGQRIAPERKRA